MTISVLGWLVIWLACICIGYSAPALGRSLGRRASRKGILGMWVPDRIHRQGQHELFESDGAKRSPGNELALPEDPQPVYEMYGHPAPPIPLLGASLPTAPMGYGWEIVVIPNTGGNPALRLVMLDLATSQVVDAIEADLVIARRWKYANDETYASFYRRAEKQDQRVIKEVVTGGPMHGMTNTLVYDDDHTEILGKVMMANLITPMVDWARLITLRYIVEHPDEAKCNYMLIESKEEVKV